MARGGLRVLCLEKNHFIGGMASTTELIRGYRFELAGSIQFPVPNEIFEDLGAGGLPDLRARGPVRQHRRRRRDRPSSSTRTPRSCSSTWARRSGIEAVLGMAEVAAWAEAPARAIGRFDVRRPPKSLDEMWASAANEAEREAIRARHVRQRHGRGRPVPARSGEARAGAQHAQLPRRQLDLPGAVLAGQRPVPRLRAGVAGHRDDVQGARRPRHHRRPPAGAVRAPRGRAAPPRQGVADRDRRGRRARRRARRGRGGDRAGGGVEPRPDGDVLPAARPRGAARRASRSGWARIDHRAAYFQAHFALSGLPEYRAPYEALNESGAGGAT